MELNITDLKYAEASIKHNRFEDSKYVKASNVAK